MQTKKVLIAGYGSIGKLYSKVLSDFNHKGDSDYPAYDVVTYDPDLKAEADYVTLRDCFVEHNKFDLAIICCPNWLHSLVSKYILETNKCCTILVEKPGFETADQWQECITQYPNSKIIMVKNNLYRNNLLYTIRDSIQLNKDDIQNVEIDWLNVDRIPNPGSWFTNKKLAFGGVSRDLMPHLLSIYLAIFNLELDLPIEEFKLQQYKLSDLTSTQYGTINQNGVYDVDDYAEYQFNTKSLPVRLRSAWKTQLKEPKIGVTINFKDGNEIFYDLGLCPESAYIDMITSTLDMDSDTYKKHNEIDLWIHNIIQDKK